MPIMGPLNLLPGRKTSISLLAALGGLYFAGCSGSEPGSDTSTAGTATAQAGATTQPQAGTSTGGSATSAGTGSGSSGSPATAGTATGGTSSAGGTAATAGTTGTAGTGGGSAGAGTAGTGGTAAGNLDKFSFFVTSMAGLIKLSKSDKGFGGDLRYGTADGLTGADKICTELAESSMPGSSAKQWHAFLSTTKVNAKDRIGAGPWYDRTGKLVAMNMAGLLKNRPDADAAIKEDLPNETGIGNHRPNPNAPQDDNHHTLTGSNAQGTLFGPNATCSDWTSTSTNNKTVAEGGVGRPKTGFCWSTGNRSAWIDGQEEGGCGAGVTGVGTVNGGSDPSNPIVGSGGGYGAFYCFALTP